MMTVKTNELPKIATNTSGTFMTQSTMNTKQLFKSFHSNYLPYFDWLKAHV